MKRFFIIFAILPYLLALVVTFAPQIANAEPRGNFTCADGSRHEGFTAEGACAGFGGPTKIPTGCPGGQPNPAPDANVQCPAGGAVVNGKYNKDAPSKFECGGVKTSINYNCNSNSGGPIYGFIRAIIKFLSGLVGLVVIMMLIIGGIRYITSAGDPKMVAAAKNQIVNAVTGLVLFGLMLAILNFLLPGGIIG